MGRLCAWTVLTFYLLAVTARGAQFRSPVILLPGKLKCYSYQPDPRWGQANGYCRPPGLAGSVLEAKLNRTETPHFYCSKEHDWEVEWLSAKAVSRPDCLLDELSVTYDPVTHRCCGRSCRALAIVQMSHVLRPKIL